MSSNNAKAYQPKNLFPEEDEGFKPNKKLSKSKAYEPKNLFPEDDENESPLYPNESKGIKGIASDAFHKAMDAAIGIPSALMQLPGEAYGAGKQILTEPKRALQNIGSGFGELGHGVLNAPGNIRDYLEKKDIVSHNAPSFRLPESVLPKDYNYAEALGAEGNKPGDELLRGLPKGAALAPLAEIIPAITAKVPGITNSSIINQLSKHKAGAIENAKIGYNGLFNDVKNMGVDKVKIPEMQTSDIIKHSQPKYHEALKTYLNDPTFENAHWAQSDLGFIVRHLQKVDEKSGLSSTQHKTLKNALAAQNRLKKSMFENEAFEESPHLKNKYNELSGEYVKNVVPYKQLEELNDYENKRITPNKAIKSLLNNDEFMLGIGQRYKPQLLANKALRSNISKILGGSILSGLGFEEGRRFLK
jgi:hypothetical protein